MAETLKGHLDALILAVVAAEPAHGYAIIEELKRRSRGTFTLPEGTVYPALHRLEQESWIEGEWHESAEGRRVRSYSLTRDGRRQLAVEKKTWMRIVQAMNALLESA